MSARVISAVAMPQGDPPAGLSAPGVRLTIGAPHGAVWPLHFMRLDRDDAERLHAELGGALRAFTVGEESTGGGKHGL